MANHQRANLIDFHVHVAEAWDRWFVDFAQANGVVQAVNLWDLRLPPRSPDPWLEARAASAPREMLFFHMPDLSGLGSPGMEARETAKVRRAAELGARGVKVWKDLGLWLRDAAGEVVRVCDPRLGWLWELAEELGLPVLIHVGDPPAFFAPLEPSNERYAELRMHPEYWYGDRDRYPPVEAIHEELVELVRQKPGCRFVLAHFGSFLDFEVLHSLLGDCANVYVDTAARITDLGRARDRESVKAIFADFPDRIVFGTDIIRTADAELPRIDTDDPLLVRYMETHFRFFESTDLLDPPLPEQGRWQIQGLGLEQMALDRLYHQNANSLLGLGGLVDRSSSPDRLRK